jgi:hypothetical protein
MRIHNIGFFPDLTARDSRNIFEQALAKYDSVKVANAFATIPFGFLSANFVNKLANPDSFLVADIHAPTNIDNLGDFNTAGCQIHLFLWAVRKNERNGTIGNQLMHAKLWLFKKGSERMLICGSHNLTKFALTGLNFEGSVVVEGDASEPIFSQVETYLDGIKKWSTRFQNSDIWYYKLLQNRQPEGDRVSVIELHNPNSIIIQIGNHIACYGANMEDFPKIRRISGQVYLILPSTAGGNRERVFLSRVIEASEMNKLNPAAVPSEAQANYMCKLGDDDTLRAFENQTTGFYFRCILHIDSEVSDMIKERSEANRYQRKWIPALAENPILERDDLDALRNLLGILDFSILRPISKEVLMAERKESVKTNYLQWLE